MFLHEDEVRENDVGWFIFRRWPIYFESSSLTGRWIFFGENTYPFPPVKTIDDMIDNNLRHALRRASTLDWCTTSTITNSGEFEKKLNPMRNTCTCFCQAMNYFWKTDILGYWGFGSFHEFSLIEKSCHFAAFQEAALKGVEMLEQRVSLHCNWINIQKVLEE